MEASAGNDFVFSALVQSAFPLLDYTLEFDGSSISYNLNSTGEDKCLREFVAGCKQGITD